MTLNVLKPNKENLQNYLAIGIFLLLLGFYDVLSSTFLNVNITGFLPSIISYLSPLILGTLRNPAPQPTIKPPGKVKSGID